VSTQGLRDVRFRGRELGQQAEQLRQRRPIAAVRNWNAQGAEAGIRQLLDLGVTESLLLFTLERTGCDALKDWAEDIG
jgi:hypothetical protein